MMLLIIIAIGFLFYLLYNKQENGAGSVAISRPQSMNALDFAKMRLAKGEISIEEFQQIKKSLE